MGCACDIGDREAASAGILVCPTFRPALRDESAPTVAKPRTGHLACDRLVLLIVVGVAALAVVEARWVGLLSVLLAASTISSWGEEVAIDQLDRFERRFANSAYVAGRLRRRAQWRVRVRAAEPRITSVARVAWRTTVAVLVLILMAAAAGVLPSPVHAPEWMDVPRFLVRGDAIVAAVSLTVSAMLRAAIRGWELDAASRPAPTPVVTTREVLRKVSRPGPRSAALVGALVLSLLLTVLNR